MEQTIFSFAKVSLCVCGRPRGWEGGGGGGGGGVGIHYFQVSHDAITNNKYPHGIHVVGQSILVIERNKGTKVF